MWVRISFPGGKIGDVVLNISLIPIEDFDSFKEIGKWGLGDFDSLRNLWKWVKGRRH